jgi:addiction module RelE/StbE family toxin
LIGLLNLSELLNASFAKVRNCARPLIEKTLRQLAEDPYHPSLRTHKLVGDLSDIWACSVDYNYRILFEFVQKSESDLDAILLLNIGSHDEVY